MKREDPHIVPLSRQALALLRDLREQYGHQPFIFPSLRAERPLSDATLRVALRPMGFPEAEMCPHGVRAFASTQLNEHNWPDACIEIQLAHKVDAKNKTKAAYNYAKHLPMRRVMMQWLADYLDSLRLQQSKPAIPYAAIQAALAAEACMHGPDAPALSIAA
jgi:integrase